MRVIAGSARRLLLKTVEGLDTRPTTDRIKETLFNMLQYDIAQKNFLDLYSGSGAIGIEGLSRGAGFCTFIEQDPRAQSCIRENLEHTKLAEQALVVGCDVITGLKRLEDKGLVYDFVFMDPPYDLGHERAVLSYLKDSALIDGESVMIVEASLGTDLSDAKSLGFDLVKEKKYKTNKHIFLTRME